MRPPRLPCLRLATCGALLLVLAVAACSDREAPTPPPRVPKPKVGQEAVDPIRTGPLRETPAPQA